MGENILEKRELRIARRAAAFRLSPIKEIELQAAKTPDAISLAQGIPYLRTPPEIIQFVEEKVRAGLCDKYSLSPGLEELREEIALSLRTDGAIYDPYKEIIVTAGSIEGMTATLLTLTERGDEVLISSPTYAAYINGVHLAEATPRFVPLVEDQGFELSVSAFEAAITERTKAIILCTPNNPTGTVFSKDTLEGLLRLAERHKLYVIVDEVYKDFYFSNDPHVSPAHFPWIHEQLVRVCSFSKAYAMTGWRVGFLAAPEHIAAHILKVHDVLVSCAPVVSQYAAIAALRFGDEARKGFVREFKERRDITIHYLDEMSEWLDYQVPKATYFAFPRIKDTVPLARNSRKLVYDILERSRVAFVEGSAFGPSGESHLRINFGRSSSDLHRGLERLGAYFQHHTQAKRPLKLPPLSIPDTTRSTPAPFHGEVAPEQLNGGDHSKPTLLIRSLVTLTKMALRKQRGKTIGILGVRGKTVVRRILARELARDNQVTSTMLSYNTLTGLCFSLLKIPIPKTLVEKLQTAARISWMVLFPEKAPQQLFVLEYGVRSVAEVNEYIHLMKPNIIVFTSGLGFDQNLPVEEQMEAAKLFIQRSNPEQVLIPEDEAWLCDHLNLNKERTTVVPPERNMGCGRSEQFGLAFASAVQSTLSSVLHKDSPS